MYQQDEQKKAHTGRLKGARKKYSALKKSNSANGNKLSCILNSAQSNDIKVHFYNELAPGVGNQDETHAHKQMCPLPFSIGAVDNNTIHPSG